MHRIIATALLSSGLVALHAPDLGAQRPDFSGTWRLDPAASRMIGPGGSSGPAQLGERRITWLIDHREPEIAVTVNVRDPDGPHDFSFRCTTDGRTCVNELAELREVREISTRWIGDTLLMTQTAKTPHGSFTADDRLTLADSGGTLVFERVVRDERGRRIIKQVFRKDANAPRPRRVDVSDGDQRREPGDCRIIRKKPDQFLLGSRCVQQRNGPLHPRPGRPLLAAAQRSTRRHEADPAVSVSSGRSGSAPLARRANRPRRSADPSTRCARSG